jgi:hypothetical protein
MRESNRQLISLLAAGVFIAVFTMLVGCGGGSGAGPSQGTPTGSLPPPSTVEPPPAPPPTAPTLGSATVSWLPPTEDVNGGPATGLAGYKIYYGTSPAELTRVVQVANPGVTTVLVEGLEPGTWYFAVTAFTVANEESERSNLGSITL